MAFQLNEKLSAEQLAAANFLTSKAEGRKFSMMGGQAISVQSMVVMD